MFKKIHLQLTLLCGGIISAVIILMTLCILYMSYENMKETQYLSFSNNIDSFCATLEQQSVITHEWLSKLEASYDYQLLLTDQGVPLLFNNRHQSDSEQALFAQVLAYYDTLMENATPVSLLPNQATSTKFFLTDSETGISYYCAVISLNNTVERTLQMVVLSSLSPLTEAILQQALLFGSIALAALVVLWIFSAVFTGKLLTPIQESHEKQKRFIAAASHELRTPLAVLLSCLEQSKKEPDAKDVSALNHIMEEEVNRMSSLLQDMLTLSQADNHAFSIRKEPTELDTLLLTVSESFEAMAHEKKLHFQVELPPDIMPPCLCDASRIRQVLGILLHNAISYAYPSRTGIIRLGASYTGRQYVLTISDSGPGIADSEKEKIWDPFYKSEKSRSTKGHFGLGLAIAHEIVTAHQGSIAITDTPGGGATFTVTLPGTGAK